MVFIYEKQFKKQLKILPEKLQDQFYDRLKMFAQDQTTPQLRVHPLKGKYGGYWSMNISGDLRAIYKRDGDEIILFALIGTHSQLYG